MWSGRTFPTPVLRVSRGELGIPISYADATANIASPQLLEKVAKGIEEAVSAVKSWYATSTRRDLLVSLKIAEELDVGANFYFYPNGNSYRTQSRDNDPTYGPDWSQGLSGGLEPMGFNMLRTLNLRVDGGPPTRDEIKIGVQHYFNTSLQAALKVWPELIDLDILFTHGVCVEVT